MSFDSFLAFFFDCWDVDGVGVDFVDEVRSRLEITFSGGQLESGCQMGIVKATQSCQHACRYFKIHV